MRLVLPLGKHGNRRGDVAEMAAIVKLGQDRLDRSVAAIDRQHRWLDPGDGPHRLADLVGALHFIMEDIGMHRRKRRGCAATGQGCPSTWDC